MTDHFVWVRQMACWMFTFDFLIFESSQHPRQVSNLLSEKPHVTRTWFEHATFWTGVRRATFAPPGLLSIEKIVTVLYLKFYRVYHVSGRHVCAHSKEHEIWTKTGPERVFEEVTYVWTFYWTKRPYTPSVVRTPHPRNGRWTRYPLCHDRSLC